MRNRKSSARALEHAAEINVATVSSAGGRQVLFGWVQFLATKCWCHRKMVPGVASRCSRSSRGSRRANAASSARSAQSSRGRGVVRRSTATSCRSTSSSTSLAAEEKHQPATESNEDQVQHQRASNTASTKAEAQASGREMAIDRGVEHVIKKMDGTIGEKSTYPRDRDKNPPSG
jgi:hypothetical protein